MKLPKATTHLHSLHKRTIAILDMAPNSVDDCYQSCTAKMFRDVREKYLINEFTIQPEFKNLWLKTKNNLKYKQKPIFLMEEHLIALNIYTQNEIYAKFNAATRIGASKYKGDFPYKSLYFLLSDSIRRIKEYGIINNQANRCLTTYRGTSLPFKDVSVGVEVRFGSFTSSSKNVEAAKKFGKTTCFKIETCLGAEISSYSVYPGEDEVLIPPYEKFKVIDKSKNKGCDVVYRLKSTGMQCNLLCSLFK
ncbi:erythroblast NAD(P)(+)--arginine ADP-ribosyltransferase-like [Megalops cyprinoides]|uniref:erythroblast NAD(P)(+)--arginine ADP-ribosyltransferase-like n=1 Tax=Megalops cyprinoides TaxID=118141 RepID=UPI001863B810|nr:erythroblast NAD(P)(+)--arginine ADP-ribosyltransferase-like [Megalops cyprinoides]